jgi:hypothetical protein
MRSTPLSSRRQPFLVSQLMAKAMPMHKGWGELITGPSKLGCYCEWIVLGYDFAIQHHSA